MQKFNKKLIESKLKTYIWNQLFITGGEKRFVSDILKFTDILVFGGVIREFVLNNFQKVDHRDIDLVITSINNELNEYLNRFLIRKNSFGGYKLKIKEKEIDLWKLDDTWGIKKVPLFNNVSEFLPETSFFNLNAVAFSLGKNELYYSEGFSKFLNERILDIEFKPNPLPVLCFIKTYEYTKKYKISLSEKLIEFITSNINSKTIKDTYTIQNKHFGRQEYSINELTDFYNKLIHNKDKKIVPI